MLKARAATLIGILLSLDEGEGIHFLHFDGSLKRHAVIQQRCSTASYCQYKLLPKAFVLLMM
jgi:hypothetical protein